MVTKIIEMLCEDLCIGWYCSMICDEGMQAQADFLFQLKSVTLFWNTVRYSEVPQRERRRRDAFELVANVWNTTHIWEHKLPRKIGFGINIKSDTGQKEKKYMDQSYT